MCSSPRGKVEVNQSESSEEPLSAAYYIVYAHSEFTQMIKIIYNDLMEREQGFQGKSIR